MKHQAITDPMSSRNNTSSFQKSPAIIILTALTLILLTLAPLYYPLIGYTIRAVSVSGDDVPNSHSAPDDIVIPTDDKCDIFSGEWVPDTKAPYYTNHTCWAIHEHQNCMKYGRPDTGFMKWKWRPDGCELPVFNPFQFLEIMRGKSMAFVGDSVGRNQMQSLICLLSRAEYPIDVSYTSDEHFKRWQYTSYNFTLAYFWTPFLVNFRTTNTGLFNLYLDEPDDQWVPYASEFDYLILSSGHWFYRPAMYYVKRRLVGCRFCQVDNITDFPMYYGYRRAFRTAFRAINGLEDFKGLVILRTFAPSHFEGGEWNKGGNCVRTKPFKAGNDDNGDKIELEGAGLELYMTQMEEFRVGERDGKKKGLRYRVLDITGPTLLRADGHPSKYGHLASENVTMYNDCVHWCLPGPIDTWSDFLLEMLKREGKRSHEEIQNKNKNKKMFRFQEKRKFM